MQLDDIFPDAASTPETGRTFLRHALHVWARENGVPDDDLPNVVHNILDFAMGSLGRAHRHGGSA